MTTNSAVSMTAIPPAPVLRHAALALLAACVFVAGTAEWVVVGVLPELSTDLHRPLPTVGVLVTVYALVVTLAGPPVTLGTRASPATARCWPCWERSSRATPPQRWPPGSASWRRLGQPRTPMTRTVQ